MIRRAALLAGALVAAGALAGCQGIIGANGGITGLTVPPGCKAQGSFSYPMPQGAIMFSCDETGAVPAPKPSANAMMSVPIPPGGAHITIDRAP